MDYINIGIESEKKGQIYIAAAAYRNALISVTDIKEKSRLINKLNHIESKFKSDNTRLEEIKSYLYSTIENRQYEHACDMMNFFWNNTNEGDYSNNAWADNDIAIINILLKISRREIASGYQSLFVFHNTPNKIIEFYYKIKFLLRRLENDFPYEKQREVMDFIIENQVSAICVIDIIKKYCIDKVKVMNTLKEIFLKEEKKDLIQEFDKYMQHVDKISINQIDNYTLDRNIIVQFIICVSDESLYKECCLYISNLNRDKVNVIITPIYNAESMTSAYNEAMNSCRADYRVYMHQDVFLLNRDFIYEFVHIFDADNQIGMVGVAGCDTLSIDGIWWHVADKEQYATLYQDSVQTFGLTEIQKITSVYKYARMLDGCILITSKDIEWRSDIFNGWHFYDISQCMEMQCKGYKLAIPNQKKIWVLHEQKFNKSYLHEYHYYRKKFIKEYRDVLYE